MPTILVIDDEKDICQCVEDAIHEEEPDFLVLKADNGLDGLKLVKEHKPDVILLDLQLRASMDGVAVLKRIKQSHPGGKVAILTGESGESIKHLSVDAFAQKPFTPVEVISLVRKLLRVQK